MRINARIVRKTYLRHIFCSSISSRLIIQHSVRAASKPSKTVPPLLLRSPHSRSVPFTRSHIPSMKPKPRPKPSPIYMYIYADPSDSSDRTRESTRDHYAVSSPAGPFAILSARFRREMHSNHLDDAFLLSFVVFVIGTSSVLVLFCKSILAPWDFCGPFMRIAEPPNKGEQGAHQPLCNVYHRVEKITYSPYRQFGRGKWHICGWCSSYLVTIHRLCKRCGLPSTDFHDR